MSAIPLNDILGMSNSRLMSSCPGADGLGFRASDTWSLAEDAIVTSQDHLN